MNKNLVIVTAMKGEVDISYKEYCLATWNYWCRKNNTDLIVLEDYIEKDPKFKPTWQRWFSLELLVQNNIEFNQVALVDVDTMIHWNAPNIFNETQGKFSACLDNDNVGWVVKSIAGYKNLFPSVDFDWTTYFNCGVVVVNSSHKELCKKITSFRLRNSEVLLELERSLRKGTDQTPVNYIVREENHEINILNKKWNLTHLNRKELLQDFMFIHHGWIWHFNGFDKDQRHYLMKETWNLIKSNYGY